MTENTPNLFGSALPAGMTLTEYNEQIANAIRREPSLREAWVRAELNDVRGRGGHIYMELVERNADGTAAVAKMRATIWASNAYHLNNKFVAATGSNLRSGIKVLVRGTAAHHPLYGLSFNITDIDPSYTIGDIERLRQEIIQQLVREGIAGFNRSLTFPGVPQRIAIISSDNAAGYGDFMKQLHENSYGFKFYTRLFPAMMQGERTSSSIRAALQRIEETIDLWDCVAIVRGGGASSDLQDFDNLELARAVAGFHLPIIVGIGHERDRTVLDELACVRLKTPTAVGAYLIDCLNNAYQKVRDNVTAIKNYTTERLRGEERQLASLTMLLPAACSDATSKARMALTRMQTLLPATAEAMVTHQKQRLSNAGAVVRVVSARNLSEGSATLRRALEALKTAASLVVAQNSDRLKALGEVADAFNPHKTLMRGYSITRVNGHSVKDAASIAPGTTIETEFADGTALSTVTEISTKKK